jgi:cytochrome P450
MPSVSFDLPDPEVALDPGEYFGRLRSCPVAHTDAHGGFWLLSRYSDVRDAAKEPALFSSASGVTIPHMPKDQLARIVEQDEPEHSRYRHPVQPWFSPGRMQELESDIRTLVTELIDRVIDDRQADLATLLAGPVPPMVIARIFGLPENEWEWFKGKTRVFLGSGSSGDLQASGTAYLDLANYLEGHLSDRETTPRSDMLTGIAQMEIDGQSISKEDRVSLAFLLLSTGFDTTVGGLGGMLYRVAGNSDIRDQLLADGSLVGNAIEESLRLETPVPGMGRMSTKDTEVAGVRVPAGERVMLLFGSANRDPAVFDEPDEFRLDRTNNKHIAFGSGVHRCVGAPLARLEMRIVLEEVLRRMPGVHLEGEAIAHYAFARAFDSIPVAW